MELISEQGVLVQMPLLQPLPMKPSDQCPHQQNFKKLSAFFGFSGCQQAHKCAIFPKSQDSEAIWEPQFRA
jgi:hypothetical protein